MSTSGEKTHTPGPWKVYDGPQISPIFSGIVCMISANERLIAVITEDESPVDPSTWSDIARLIAAAPDLLACALAQEELATNSFEGDPQEAIIRVRAMRRAAISKATSPDTGE